ncbi:Dolichyl-phosphate-mannose-protein mannosyltransferase [uncultured archaeon]|nr:Dolichyl-phosphate-mannose-protein mannosyltransferase [uncultured archaeon]
MRKIKLEYILLGLILIFALFLRLYSLSHSPLWIDESTSSMASKMILEKGIPVFDSGTVYSRAYVFHYTEAFFLLFGINDFNARLASVLFGMLTIVLVYFIGKEYSRSGGIISALFFSVFYLEVFFSRQARFYQLFQLMFFLCLYLLYKSGETKNKKHHTIYLILSLVAFFIALDTQLAALVLAPFIILHIILYNKHKYLAILPAVPLVMKFLPATKLSSGSAQSAVNYTDSYYSFTVNMQYLLILFIPGVIWSFIQKKKLTLMLVIPSLVLLIGIFSLQVFALRYAYFFVFILVLYSSLLLAFLYEKYGNIMLITIICVLIIPSNFVFPFTYVNVIKPINYNHGYSDFSTPETNYLVVPSDLVTKLENKNNILVSFFSSDVEWYIRKPDYVIPFSMDGRGTDQISYNKTLNGVLTSEQVDTYSGAKILTPETPLKKPYYVNADSFSTSKLKPAQRESFDKLILGCGTAYSAVDLKIYSCA